MKKLLFFFGLLWAAGANAQFTPGQLLTAGELNNQFALYSKLSGATFTGPVTVPSLSVTGAINATTTGTMPLYSTTGTGVNAPHMVNGSVALSSGTATVTLSGSAVFTSSGSYTCTANDATAANAVKVSNTSGTQFALTGTGTDTVAFMCAGN